MGTWGTGSFDNDTAADFLAEATGHGDLSPVHEAIDNVLTSTEYVDADDACQAIVAAEILAAALGRPTPAAQQEERIGPWLARMRPAVDAALATRAGYALDRILEENSELLERWEETDAFLEWHAGVIELRRQFQA